ncbi:MAG: hypothetical protein AAF202_10785, partial [Pseudomonadota bacterium]
MKSFFLMSFLWFSPLCVADSLSCGQGVSGLNKHEKTLLEWGRSSESQQLKVNKKAARALACLLKIYANSQGLTKVIASNMIRPFIGGPITEGMPKRKGYKRAYLALKAHALHDEAFAMALGKKHAAITWDFYRMFCDEKSELENLYCAEMLPSVELVSSQGFLESLSAVFVVKQAHDNLGEFPKAQQKVKEK